MGKKTLSAEVLNKRAVRIIASSLLRPAIVRRFLGLLTFNNNPSFIHSLILPVSTYEAPFKRLTPFIWLAQGMA